VPWGFNGGWAVGSTQQAGTLLEAFGPTTANPNDPYAISVWNYWVSNDFDTPFEAGQIVELQPNPNADPIANPNVIFTKP
jgi:hypothetical protein